MKKTVSFFLAMLMVVSMGISVFPIAVSAYTTPETLTQEQVLAKIDQLAKKLDGKYFTYTTEVCEYKMADGRIVTPTKHASCKTDASRCVCTEPKKLAECTVCVGGSWVTAYNCRNSKVFEASWFKNLFSDFGVPSGGVNNIQYQYYPNGGDGYPTGDTCHGFAAYAQWYIFASENTDKISRQERIEGTLTKEFLQNNALPGDIIRTSGHSMIFISANSTTFTVLDCNWRMDGTGPCLVHKHDISYTHSDVANKSIAITRAANYDTSEIVPDEPEEPTTTKTQYRYHRYQNINDDNEVGICGHWVANTYNLSTSEVIKVYTDWLDEEMPEASTGLIHAYFPESCPNYGCDDPDGSNYIRYTGNSNWPGKWYYEETRTVSNSITLTLDPNDGLGESWTKTVPIGAKYYDHITDLAEYEGRFFVGWYTEKEGGTLITEDTVITSNTNHTIYGRWTEPVDYHYFDFSEYTAIVGEEITIKLTVLLQYVDSDPTFTCDFPYEITDVWTDGFVKEYTIVVNANQSGWFHFTALVRDNAETCYLNVAAKSSTGITGICGEAMTFSLNTDTGVLRIEGSGEMNDYTYMNSPWSTYDSDIKTVVISSDISSISKGVFDNLINLKNFEVADDNETYCDIDGILFSKDKKTLIRYPAGGATTYVIPTHVENIGYRAFLYCENLTNLTISENVKNIGESAFGYCVNIANILTMPENVVSIGDWAFEGCKAIKCIIFLPKNVTIGNNAFLFCSSLEEICLFKNSTADIYFSDECKKTYFVEDISVENVTLNKTSATMTEGESLTLTATVAPTNATNKNVTWSSNNTSVATVANGVVTAKSAGTATITVKTADGNKTATCTVTVKAKTIAVTGVSLNKTTATLTEGESLTLTATVAPANATNKNVTWSSSNTSVATVANGVVTAKSAGTATIMVKTADGSKTASCNVTVNALVTDPEVWVYTEAKNSVVQGSEFTYKVYLAGTYDGYVFELVQPAGLTITNVEAASSGANIDNIDGTWMISVIGGLEKQEAEKEEIITVTVSVAKDAALGDRTLSLAEVIITTEFGEEISAVEYNYATITVTDQIPGDINGDGKFNYTDVSKLYAYFRKKTTVSENIDVDINGDGKFNYTDVSKLYAIFRKKADFN